MDCSHRSVRPCARPALLNRAHSPLRTLAGLAAAVRRRLSSAASSAASASAAETLPLSEVFSAWMADALPFSVAFSASSVDSVPCRVVLSASAALSLQAGQGSRPGGHSGPNTCQQEGLRAAAGPTGMCI